jgi:hypothetical protein
LLQQKGSTAQIDSQHAVSEQPGVVLATQQSFVDVLQTPWQLAH